MKKKVLCLAMALVMLAGGSLTAHAEELKGQDGWRAEFNGKKIVSNFDSGTLADEAGNVQPGDSITLKVEIKNSDTGSTDWYMTNEAIQSLEDAADVAQGGAYSYRLAYKGPKGQEIEIYNSENVGGESATGKLEGLHQATDTLNDYFYLDRLESGKSGTVTLKVTVEGETQNNDYQKTLAKLQMTFAVEKVTASVVKHTPGKVHTETRMITNRVQTGDTAHILLFCLLGLTSGLVFLFIGVKSSKRRKNEQKGE